jgi:hypothetical protein
MRIANATAESLFNLGKDDMNLLLRRMVVV